MENVDGYNAKGSKRPASSGLDREKKKKRRKNSGENLGSLSGGLKGSEKKGNKRQRSQKKGVERGHEDKKPGGFGYTRKGKDLHITVDSQKNFEENRKWTGLRDEEFKKKTRRGGADMRFKIREVKKKVSVLDLFNLTHGKRPSPLRQEEREDDKTN